MVFEFQIRLLVLIVYNHPCCSSTAGAQSCCPHVPWILAREGRKYTVGELSASKSSTLLAWRRGFGRKKEGTKEGGLRRRARMMDRPSWEALKI